jgi:hypothetical protein
MKHLLFVFITLLATLPMAHSTVAYISRDGQLPILEYFPDTYKVEFCVTFNSTGCVDEIAPSSLTKAQQVELVQQAIVRYFRINDQKFFGFPDSLPVFHFMQWSQGKRAFYERLTRYDYSNERRFFIGNEWIPICAGCDDDVNNYEIVYNVSKHMLHVNHTFTQGWD